MSDIRRDIKNQHPMFIKLVGQDVNESRRPPDD